MICEFERIKASMCLFNCKFQPKRLKRPEMTSSEGSRQQQQQPNQTLTKEQFVDDFQEVLNGLYKQKGTPLTYLRAVSGGVAPTIAPPQPQLLLGRLAVAQPTASGATAAAAAGSATTTNEGVTPRVMRFQLVAAAAGNTGLQSVQTMTGTSNLYPPPNQKFAVVNDSSRTVTMDEQSLPVMVVDAAAAEASASSHRRESTIREGSAGNQLPTGHLQTSLRRSVGAQGVEARPVAPGGPGRAGQAVRTSIQSDRVETLLPSLPEAISSAKDPKLLRLDVNAGAARGVNVKTTPTVDTTAIQSSTSRPTSGPQSAPIRQSSGCS